MQYVTRIKEDRELERQVMKDVLGWEAGQSVYRNGRFVRPTISLSDYLS